MQLNQLEKAVKIFGQISILDKEIVELERYAMTCANEETVSCLEMKILNLNAPPDKQCDPLEDEFVVQINNSIFALGQRLRSYHEGTPPNHNNNEHRIRQDISVNATMQIIGILICEKQYKRSKLLGQLKKWGVEI